MMSEKMLTRDELRRKLAILDRNMMNKLKAYPNSADFRSAFAEEVEPITDHAGGVDYDWTLNEINYILAQHGKPPYEAYA